MSVTPVRAEISNFELNFLQFDTYNESTLNFRCIEHSLWKLVESHFTDKVCQIDMKWKRTPCFTSEYQRTFILIAFKIRSECTFVNYFRCPVQFHYAMEVIFKFHHTDLIRIYKSVRLCYSTLSARATITCKHLH